MIDYKIHDIDYWEQDAVITIGDDSFYFQFDDEPTFEEAMMYIRTQGGEPLKRTHFDQKT